MLLDTVSLPNCSPPRALSPPLACASGTALGALCVAVSTILERASCEELASQPYVQHLIESVGLAGDFRRERIYGPAASLMRHVGSHTGLWQDPKQISRALLVLGSLPSRPHHVAPAGEPFRYVEVGVYTAWTCCLVSAYLQRVAAGERGFAGLAVDVKVGNIAAGTFDLMKRLNVSFEARGSFDKKLRESKHGKRSGASEGSNGFDACFIDGDHGYGAVRGDYAQLAPHCGATMFHDIQDSSTMIHDAFSGGVPMFWAHARSHVRAARAVELTMQGSPYWPVFGIGVILPGPTGTAEPDDGTSVAEWPKWRGEGPAALWRALCVRSESTAEETNRRGARRLPAEYVARSRLCPVANATNLENILAATKRTVPKPLLQFAMSLPWNESRPY